MVCLIDIFLFRQLISNLIKNFFQNLKVLLCFEMYFKFITSLYWNTRLDISSFLLTLFKNYLESLQTALADLRGCARDALPLSIEFLSIPCSFRQTFCQIICWHSTRISWIHHWIGRKEWAKFVLLFVILHVGCVFWNYIKANFGFV